MQHDIEIDRHFIKDKINSGLVGTTYVPIGFQIVDIFTKRLPQGRSYINSFTNLRGSVVNSKLLKLKIFSISPK